MNHDHAEEIASMLNVTYACPMSGVTEPHPLTIAGHRIMDFTDDDAGHTLVIYLECMVCPDVISVAMERGLDPA